MAHDITRVALVGCGDAGTAHALTVHGHVDVKLVAAYDTDPDRAERLTAKFGGRAATSLFELIDQKPDVVVTAVGPAAQPDTVAALALARYQGGVLCEKPLATSMAAAQHLLAVARAHGITLAVNHQRRFGLGIRRALDWATGGALGRLIRVEGYSQDATLFDWAPHWIDVAFLAAGDAPVRWVAGTVDLTDRRSHAGLLLEGSGLLVWEHENGVRGQLECGTAVAGLPLLRLIGTSGVMEFGSVEETSGADGFRRGPVLRVLGLQVGWRELDPGESAFAAEQWYRSLAEIGAAVREGRTPAHSGERALRALEVCLAGYEAARSGGRVTLPLHPDRDIRELLDA